MLKSQHIFLLFAVFTLIQFEGIAQENEGDAYFDASTIRMENKIYDNKIASVYLYQTNNPLSDAVLELNGQSNLEFSFDDLDGELNTYYYEIIHCTKNWEKSDLFVGEYIIGLPEDIINSFEFSRNPMQKFVNFRLQIPNQSMKITISSNYVLHIYRDGDKKQTVITKRFIIYEDLVTIKTNVRPASRASDNAYKQEVDFKILHPNYNLTDPYQEVFVKVIQNDNWNTTIADLKPLFVKDLELDYDYDEENQFYGINEFRNFDIQTTNYNTEFVKDFYYKDSSYHADLFIDKKRAFKVYVQRPDINGKAIINVRNNGFNEPTDGEYVWVHFKFHADEMKDGDIYISGGFCDWNIPLQNKLKYDAGKGYYHADLYLKQGYYNYAYYLVKDREKPTLRYTEGTHSETENNYAIIVYHRSIQVDYDRIVGYRKFNSRKISLD